MTLITIAVIRKFSVIYLHVRSEVGYQYGKNNMIRIIKDIFHPSPRDTLKRAKFVIYTLSSWIILFTIMPKNQYLDLIFIIANTYIHINIGAKRIRDSGCRALYFIALSIGVNVFCTVSVALNGADCDNIGIQLNIAWVILTTLLLSFIASSKQELSS